MLITPYHKFGMVNIAYSDELIKIITPLGYKGTAKYYIENFNIPLSVDGLVDIMYKHLFSAYRDEIILKPGVIEYLNVLKNNGHSINILSASPYKMVSAVLKRCGVIDLFDHIWSCEDFNMTKGEPQIYWAAVERAGGVLEDTIFFDDNLLAIQTAVKAGIYTIGVYDNASIEYIEEIKKTADRFIYSLEEMV